MVKDWINCLRRIKELKLYIVEFDKDGIMKFKIYLSNCIVNNENH